MAIDDDNLPRLQARIAGLGHLQEPVRAMRAMAGARLQEGQAALPGSSSHVDTVERALRQAAALLPPGDADPGNGTGNGAAVPAALVMIGSEHGFAGGFNDHVLDRAAAALSAAPGADGPPLCCAIGTRLARLAGERGITVAWHLPMATHAAAATALARATAGRLAGTRRVVLLHARHRAGGPPAVAPRAVLPLPVRIRQEAMPPPLHHLAPARLWRALAEEYLFAVLADALLESFVAENAARLAAMEAADRNISDRLEALQRHAQSLRQEAITAELLDVVTGELALLD